MRIFTNLIMHRKRACIQLVIVITFFFSVFAIIWSLMTTQPICISKANEHDQFDVNIINDIFISNGNRVNPKHIKAGVNKLPPLEEFSSNNDIYVPPSIDTSVLMSINFTLKSEYNRLSSVFKFLSEPTINQHDFNYTHNPITACIGRRINIVIAVNSATANFEKRLKTRQGLKGRYTSQKHNNATLLFFMGRSNHHNESRIQVQINEEMRKFGDIVQEDFIDTYKNMTTKTMAVLKWVSTNCPYARYVIKCDDDVSLKPLHAVQAMERTRERFGNFILGKWNTKLYVQRNKWAKNYVSKEDYPYLTFPPHVLGGAMGFPVTTAKLLFQVSLRVKLLWLDDVFFSAFCAPKANIPVLADPSFDFKHKEW